MRNHFNLMGLGALFLTLVPITAYAQGSWTVSPLDQRGKALKGIDLSLETPSQTSAEAHGESWKVSLAEPDALFVPVKLNLQGANGIHAPLTINLVAKSRPEEKP